MSITGSLLISNITSSLKMGKTLPSSLNSSISNAGFNDASIQNKHQLHTNFQQPQLPSKCMNSKRKHAKYTNMYTQIYPDHNNYLHLNSLWSIWYGVLLTLFQGYLAVHGAYRFLGCSLIQWKIEPVTELNLQIILSGLVFVILPFFFTSAVFKVGNFANDGIKLGSSAKERRCSMTPQDSVEDESRSGTLQTLWIHGGPTAAFIHILIAMCLLLPRLLLEARIIENGLLPKETIWQTELDFMIVNRRNLVVLSVIASPYQNNSLFESQEDEDYLNVTLFPDYSSFAGNANNLLNRSSKQDEQISIQTRTKTKYIQQESSSIDTSIESSKNKEYSDSFELYNETNEYLVEKNLKHKTLISAKSIILTTTSQSDLKKFEDEETSSISVFTPNILKEKSSKTKIEATPIFKHTTVISPNINSITLSTPTAPNFGSSQISYSNHHNIKSTRKLHRKAKLPSNFAKHKNYHQHHNEKSTFNRFEDRQPSKNTRFDESRKQSIDLFNVNKEKFVHSNSGGKVFEHTPTLYEEIDYDRTKINTFPKSLTTISTTTRDSNIHIVKPEKLPEIIPSTPLSSNSKIIEIKSNIYKKYKRAISTAEENQIELEPEYLIGDLSSNDSSEYIEQMKNPKIYSAASDGQTAESESNVVHLDGFAGMLQIFFGIDKPINVKVFNHPPSAEFVNLLFALLVWSVRYPAVFWATTKSFAIIFSLQMIIATADIVFSYIGISSLFKIQIYGQLQTIQHLGLILNARVTIALYLLSILLTLSSSMVMYLYGHARFSAKVRDRSIISFKSNESWIYFAHCASLCYILSLSVVKAPLVNDLSATYRYNLHGPTFLAALVSVMHILLWVIIWIGLTVKRRWNFKLPPLDAYSLIGKVTTQPLLLPNKGSLTNTITAGFNNSTVIGLTNTNTSDNVELKINCDNPEKSHNETSSSNIINDGTSNDIYWPKTTPNSPKLKVTFNEVTSTSDDDHHRLMGDHEQNDGKRNSPRGASLCITSTEREVDDGEYATLRSASETIVGIDLGDSNNKKANNFPITTANVLHLNEYDGLPPPPPPHMVSSMTITSHTTTVTINPVVDYVNCNSGSVGRLFEDNLSEEGKLLACVRDDSVTYASTHNIEPPLPPPPCQLTDFNINNYTSSALSQISQTIPKGIISLSSEEQFVNSPLRGDVPVRESHLLSSATQRSLKRADSGVPQEALTPRSDSTSSGNESTTSPPERAPSESSSGVHSAEEKDTDVLIRSRAMYKQLPKLPPPVIQEEPYGRCTNMRMSSFVGINSNSATLPLLRSNIEEKVDYSQHCSTMPLCFNNNHYQQQTQSAVYATSAQCMSQSQNTTDFSSFKTPLYANSTVAMSGHNILIQQTNQQPQRRPPPPPPSQVTHTILANGVRYSNPNILKRSPYVKGMESVCSYQTFSKNNQENPHISEDRDSANYSMSSDQDYLYTTANGLH